MVKDGIVIAKRYEVISKIGAGGMADVYKGRDLVLNRYVAIKVLKKEYREDENFVRKFRTEAQATAGLANPNIVSIYDVGEDRGLYYIVMELVEGVTLKEYIKRKGRLPFKEVVSIALQMCNGIQAAHEAGLIHRDIKPQNIIIAKDGKVKVTDFGIAKTTTSNTISSNAMGSVHYTSPEQARGAYSDVRSDIYSIGITLYEMVTGQVPFNGESTVEVAMKHLQEEITPPSRLVPDIPHSLEMIILKCTQKNEARRYQNVGELIQDLRRSLEDPEGDFVVIPPLRDTDTRILTDEDLDDNDEDEEDSGDEEEEESDEEGEDEDEDYEGSDEEVNPRMRTVIRVLLVVVIVIIAGLVIYGIGRAAGIFRFAGEEDEEEEEEVSDLIEVPSVVGKTESEAKQMLNELGLGYKVSAYEDSEQYESGLISSQSIAAGEEVQPNTVVTVIVSSGLVVKEEYIIVPDVAGMSESSAKQTLEAAGFTVGSSEYEYSDSYSEGLVTRTSPAYGNKMVKGSDTQVRLYISRGSEKVTVPDVVGMSDDSAQSAIKNAGLNVTATYQYNDDVESGRVVSQSVSGGTQVSPGTTVNIVVSNGSDKVTVQNFVGSYEEALLEWADENGLKTNMSRSEYTADPRYPEGTIIAQDPSSGSVSKGSTITYRLSLGAEPQQEEEPEPDTIDDFGLEFPIG